MPARIVVISSKIKSAKPVRISLHKLFRQMEKIARSKKNRSPIPEIRNQLPVAHKIRRCSVTEFDVNTISSNPGMPIIIIYKRISAMLISLTSALSHAPHVFMSAKRPKKA